MPADRPRLQHAEIRSVPDERRRGERRVCSLAILLHTPHGELRARIVDVSGGGIGLRIETLLPLSPGARLSVSDDRLGSFACTLRWVAHPRYGAAFLQDRLPAGLKALYDGLPPAPGEIV